MNPINLLLGKRLGHLLELLGVDFFPDVLLLKRDMLPEPLAGDEQDVFDVSEDLEVVGWAFYGQLEASGVQFCHSVELLQQKVA